MKPVKLKAWLSVWLQPKSTVLLHCRSFAPQTVSKERLKGGTKSIKQKHDVKKGAERGRTNKSWQLKKKKKRQRLSWAPAAASSFMASIMCHVMMMMMMSRLPILSYFHSALEAFQSLICRRRHRRHPFRYLQYMFHISNIGSACCRFVHVGAGGPRRAR